MDCITGQGGGAQTKSQVRNLASSLITALFSGVFSSTSILFLQRVFYRQGQNRTKKPNSYSQKHGYTASATAQWEFHQSYGHEKFIDRSERSVSILLILPHSFKTLYNVV